MQNKITNRITSIEILQSIDEGELDNGRYLYGVLQDLAAEIGIDAPISLHNVPTACDFRNCLRKLCARTKDSGASPVIHIECHGNKQGLKLADGSFLVWEHVYRDLADINIASCCNLLLVVGACESAWAAELLLEDERPAFWGLVAPFCEVSAGTVRAAYTAFYRQLLMDGNGDTALAELRAAAGGASNPFYCATVETMFRTFYHDHWIASCTPSRLWHRAKRIRERWRAGNNPKSRLSIQDIVVEIERRERSKFELRKMKYFMLDLYPENAARFRVDYDELRQRVEAGRNNDTSAEVK